MKKRRIVLASILKPVNETRMFEKMGCSLADSGEFEVVIIGTPSKTKPAYTNIQFSTLSPFSRLSLMRLLAPLTVFRKLIRIKPDVLIICTHELLLIACAYKLFSGIKVIYDVQENYFRNIRYTKAFAPVLRSAVACWVRMKEILSAPFIDLFFLAEKGYAQEFLFHRKRYTVIENKFKKPAQFKREPAPNIIQLLFSGTIAESTGVFEAVELVKQLHEHDAAITLTIIGYCAQPAALEKLHGVISKHAFISLKGGDQPVSHSEIINAISRSHVGIVFYPSSPHTENSIPTKLYEYMGCELPILLQNHKPWVDLASSYPAAIVIDDFWHVRAKDVLEAMKKTKFYTHAPKDVYWDSETPRLLKAIESL